MSPHRLLALGCVLLLLGCNSKQPRSSASERRLQDISGVLQGGRVEEASRLLREYVKAEPRDDLAFTLLGHALLEQQKLDEAGAAYATAVQLNPRRVEAHTGQGLIARRRGEYDKAMEAYQRAVSIDASYAQAYSSMTTIALKRGQFDLAVTHAEKGYALDKDDPTVAANLAVAYHYAGNMARRDELTQVAEALGYKSMDKLRGIYSGELDVRD